MRRLSGGEEAIADHAVTGRKATASAWGRSLTRRSRSVVTQWAAIQASVAGSVAPRSRTVVRHRQQRVQIERARQAASDPGNRQSVVRLDPGAELPRQEPAAGDRQPPLARRRRHRQGKHVLFEAGDVEPSGDGLGAARRRGEVTHRSVRATHRQMVVAPVRRSVGALSCTGADYRPSQTLVGSANQGEMPARARRRSSWLISVRISPAAIARSCGTASNSS